MTLMFIGLSLPQWQKPEGKHFLQPIAAMCTLHCTAFLYWDLQSQQISEKEVNLNNIFNIQVNRTIKISFFCPSYMARGSGDIFWIGIF